MAFLKAGNKRGNVGPSLRGQFYSYEKDQGMILSSWPKPRGAPKSEAQRKAQELFVDACKAMKRMDGDFIEYARLNSAGTPMLPRDALMAALYGRGPVFILPNGERRYPMANRVDMSMLLDSIADSDGMLLYRDKNDLWVGLAPSLPGRILTMGDDGMPVWGAAVSGGSSNAWTWTNYTTVTTSANALRGLFTQALVPQTISRVSFRHSLPAAGSFNLSLVFMSATNVIETIELDQVLDITRDGTPHQAIINLSHPVDIPAFQVFGVCIRRTDGSGAVNTALWSATAMNWPMPQIGYWGYFLAPRTTLSVGDVFTTGTTAGYNFAWQ